MTFKMEPQAIRALAGHLQEANDAAEAAAQYSHRYSDIGAHGTGLLRQAMGSHADLVAQQRLGRACRRPPPT